MKKIALIIPATILLLVAVIFLNIPVIRNIMVFVFLSFLPGFVLLKTFKLKGLSLLHTFLLSVGLSLVASMFTGFLINELYLILGLSQPLSIIPLTAAISTFTLVVFFVSYRRDFSINFVSLNGIFKATRSYFPLALILIILPLLAIVGSLYVNVPIMIILCLTIAVLCVMSAISDKLIPCESYPFLIFSISISILLLNLLLSKNIVGEDANLEYYIFKIAQVKGYWGPIDDITNPWSAIVYNSMLSISVLPNVYSVLMNLKNELLFKILYSFIFSLVPITLYGIYKNETGKRIGLLSTFFFIFSVNAFFGELIGVNRQIVGEFFLMLSIFLWLDKAVPIKEKRILLVIFGISVAISHYSLAVIYLIFISLVVIISSIKSKFDTVFNAFSILAIFGVTFFYYAFSSGSPLTSPLISILNIVQTISAELTTFNYSVGAGSVAVVTTLPEVFTAATWMNLVISSVVNILLLIGIFIVILLPRRLEFSDKYRLITIFASTIFAISLLFPWIAITLNFTRFYAIALLFLSPFFVIGALSLSTIIQSILRKRKINRRSNNISLCKHGKRALLVVAVFLSAYFLLQSGYIHHFTGGGIHSKTFDYYRMKTSEIPQIQIQFYNAYTSEQDVLSAVWLSKYANATSIVYSDISSRSHTLINQGLIPWNLIILLTNTTEPNQGNLVYLNSLNVVKGLVPTSTGWFNSSEISSSLYECNLIYSNGNSEVRMGVGSG